jgi:hypothetical protein
MSRGARVVAMLSIRTWFYFPMLPALLSCSGQAGKTFQVVTIEQGWQCDSGQENCWRELEVSSAGSFVATDSEGRSRFPLTSGQLAQISDVVGDADFERALRDETGSHCGSFFGDAVFFPSLGIMGRPNARRPVGA